jgi:hypothetical protein
MTNTPTPRTDAACASVRAWSNVIETTSGASHLIEHARQLERELVEAQRKAKALDWLVADNTSVISKRGILQHSFRSEHDKSLLDAIEAAMNKEQQ